MVRQLQTNMKTRDVSWMKPKGFEDYFTLKETSLAVQRDPAWLRKLEAADRIPKAHRVKVGKLSVRLWSPRQVDEIRTVISRMKRGRPSG
jgi:hypothetical protein